MLTNAYTFDKVYDMTDARQCPVCDQRVPVINYGVERGREVGYLARHSRPGIARTSKCRGSFGGWVGRRIDGGKGPEHRNPKETR